ncbi:SIS domain-containing protein [soil metagenome]
MTSTTDRPGDTRSRRGSDTYREILEQPAAIAEAIRAVTELARQLQQLVVDVDGVILTGCGSTFHAATALRRVFARAVGVPTLAVAAGDLMLDESSSTIGMRRPLLVAVSRSGATSETVASVSHFREHAGASTLAFTTDSESDLARLADASVLLPTAREQSVAQTKSFTAMMMAGHSTAAALAGGVRALDAFKVFPDLFETQLHGDAAARAEQVGMDQTLEHFVFLGTADRVGLAAEGALKMKEMSLSSTDVATFLEYRHGPMSMVDPSTHIVGVGTNRWQAQERRVLDELEQLGGRVTSVGAVKRADVPTADLALDADALLCLPFLPLLAYHRARRNGRDPDAPRHLTQVIVRDFETPPVIPS